MPPIQGVGVVGRGIAIVFAGGCSDCSLPSYARIPEETRQRLGKNLLFVVPDSKTAAIYTRGLGDQHPVIVSGAPEGWNVVFSPRVYVVDEQWRLSSLQKYGEPIHEALRDALQRQSK